MSDENSNHDLSLDDIFSRLRKQDAKQGTEVGVPFKFLDSYTLDDKSIFFGRDKETEDIFRKLYSGKLTLVYGKSGTGKSSIINCGLLSRIPQEDIFTINIRCGKSAYKNFLSGIKKHSKTKLDHPVEILEDIFYEQSKPITLIFDQFEEVFILSNEDEREKLARTLGEILKSRLKINIILVIREEFFASLTEFETHIPGLYENRTRIEKMSKSAAKLAITEPCKVCNVGIEENLADAILDQLVVQSDGLELTWLQVLMDKMYRIAVERDFENPVIMHEDLARMGRMGNVLSDFLDEQLMQMPNGEEGELVLKTMISTDGTKKQLTLNEISESLQTTGHALDHGQIEEILRYFVSVRIITDQDEQGYYELRHDAIASRIYDRMTTTEKELVEIKTFLDNSYKIYKKRKVLLTENDLKYIAIFESKLILNQELREFIKTSKKEVQRVKLRRRNIALAAAIVFISILSGFTIWALNERTKALEQFTIAEEKKDEAIIANTAAERASLQALEEKDKAEANEEIAIEQGRIAELQKREAISANRDAENARKEALDEKNRALENERLAQDARLESENAKNEALRAGREAQFYLYLFNGKELANKSLIMQEDPTLKALLALTARNLISYGYDNYSPEGSLLRYDNEILQALQEANLSFETDSLVNGEIWALDSRNERIVYSNRIGELSVSTLEAENPGKLPDLITRTNIDLPARSLVRALSFHPSEDKLACGTLDGTVSLINLPDKGPPEIEIVHKHNNNRVLHLAFLPGKEWLISSSMDRTIHVWDIQQKISIATLQVVNPVQEFVLTQNDHLVFTDGAGNILEWDLNNVNSQPEIFYTNVNRQPYKSIAYSNAHNWLVATSMGNIEIFQVDPNLRGNPEPERFTVKHNTPVSQLEFSPDQNWLVSASPDAIMLWDLRDVGSKETEKLVPLVIENMGQIFSLGFDQDNKYLLYGDMRLLHIYPIDIDDIYTRLKIVTGGKELSEQEWNYYIKGELERPN